MDLINWTNDFLRGLGSGDSPDMKALLKELGLPRRTAGIDSLDHENILETQAKWLVKNFGWYAKEHFKSQHSADTNLIKAGVIIDPWRRAYSTADQEIVKPVVAEFLLHYLSSCLDRPIIFAHQEQAFVNRRSSNTVIDAFVRKLQDKSEIKQQAIVLLEVKNEQRHWEATAHGRPGFFTSEEVAYLGLIASFVKPPACTFASSQDTEPTVSISKIEGFSTSDVPDYGMEIWNEAE